MSCLQQSAAAALGSGLATACLNALTLSARRVSMVDALLHQLLEQLLRVLAVDLAGNQRPKDHSTDHER